MKKKEEEKSKKEEANWRQIDLITIDASPWNE